CTGGEVILIFFSFSSLKWSFSSGTLTTYPSCLCFYTNHAVFRRPERPPIYSHLTFMLKFSQLLSFGINSFDKDENEGVAFWQQASSLSLFLYHNDAGLAGSMAEINVCEWPVSRGRPADCVCVFCRWSLNGTLIDLRSDYRRRMSGGNLIISSLERDQDTGIYQCTAFNTWGTIHSQRSSLQFAYLENFKAQSRNAVNVREGQGVVLLCGAPMHSGELTFAWVFNEYPYFVQQDRRRFVSQETGNLYIAKVEPSDVGNYTCVVNNTITRGKVLSSPTPLVLRNDGAMGEYEPKIEVHFPDTVPAAKGLVVRLECFALGNPVPEITWRRTSGEPFPSKVKLKNANAILEIPRFQQEDSGTYECVAENSRGKNTARGRLSFHAKPHWLQTMRDTAVSIEENLFWECKASGRPKPSYNWLKNGEPLAAEGRVQIENGALSIVSLNLSDAGMYQCVAENKHGIIYASAELMVLVLCGNHGLLDFFRITLLPNGTLKITNLTRRDGGSYTCIAKNQFGTASTKPTRITQGPGNMEIIVGESIVLPCQIACDPALDVSFSWSFNGQLIDFDRDRDHFERVGGVSHVIFSSLKLIWVIRLMLQLLRSLWRQGCPPGFPETVLVEEITDSTAQLSWTPGRDNGSPITGYMVQARTPFTVGWQAVDTVPEAINGNTLTATVVDLNAWVEYEFRVVAINSVGMGEPSPPSPKTRTEDAIPDTAPTEVGGGGGTKSELVITWEPVPEEVQNGEGFGYIITLRPQGGVTWTRAVITIPGISKYTFRNDTILPFSPYEVKVGAFNKRGEGPFSSIVTVFSAEEVPSMAPERVWGRSVSAAQIEVTWEPLLSNPERVLGYEVVYWEDDTKPDTVGKVRISGNYSAVNVSGLVGSTHYYLTVSAFNTAGTGPPSLPINATTKKPPPGQPPLNVEWTLIGSQLTLHWDPVIALETESEVTGYLVSYRRHRQHNMSTLITDKTAAELTLSINDNYVIQVKSLSEGGEGEGSEPIHIHRLSKLFVFSAPPLSLHARNGDSVSQVVLSFYPLLISRWHLPFPCNRRGSFSVTGLLFLFLVCRALQHIKQRKQTVAEFYSPRDFCCLMRAQALLSRSALIVFVFKALIMQIGHALGINNADLIYNKASED
uniref:Contactin 3b n=1 Tax=Denticeps clupeoides TaxID=299321 RepID=A0AAY4E8W2_9TELE